MTRRHFGTISASAISSLLFGGACRLEGSRAQIGNGRLSARPKANVTTTARGTERLNIGDARDAFLRVPANAPATPLPLLVMLHGAGSAGAVMFERYSASMDAAGVAVLAPDSRSSTWDAVNSGFGADVAFLDRALARVFEVVSVDPDRLAVGGFSDGATYALSLGLVNGDLFRTIAAFSPGFVVDGAPHGKPRIFISHGIKDEILPIDRCSRMIVPSLKQRGYDVTFREFNGGHEVPPAIALEGFSRVSGRVAAVPPK